MAEAATSLRGGSIVGAPIRGTVSTAGHRDVFAMFRRRNARNIFAFGR
ncbi:hypothetical protein LI99_22275 [Mycolicibacterium smegmatis]|uniref:Uncharacterized protein n=2 Tax=Mycolicibacterium smegmatis (strain ATCC 700084 / mc(2)155) TaxID=246196 RepID=A0R0T6_MYCS2|nr:hypothetical protein MSMEG_4503 [Mycolicibacterium smegmatis MC2 155]AIU16199.1 hypothetical protein LI99_22275 [Mycolicibacterium smegmatis]AFP40844.1 hypothetical protein MSMEI_4390 [Mycolicibacterium smegmatis MC2 155]AIU09574.1 hypothetical protein LJ00_22270 [Mycolicibacterium smegmatis MC2 155]AIU22822.1 hypothetical protein LI98_22280 [Mycolicibacterium smegmatis]